MPLQEEQIRQVFQQLGMETPSTQRQGLAGTGGLVGGASGSRGLTDMVASRQQPPQIQPGAIERHRDDNFLSQFGKGLVSPVTDTLSGFGVTNPREMPSSIGGIIGNIAGSLVGWTALTVATAGIGTKVGLVGAGAAKIGAATTAAGKGIATLTGGKAAASGAITGGLISQGTGGMIAKGAAWGGLSQAHTWSFGQQEYENIPKDLLVGALTGGAMGGVVGKWAGHMQKSGKLSATPQGLINRFVREHNQRHPNSMVTIDDPAALSSAINRSSSREAVFIRDVLRRSDLDSATTSNVKNLSSSIRKGLQDLDVTSRQRTGLSESLDMLDGVKTKADLDNVVKRMRLQVKNISKQLGEDVPETANRLNDSLNQLKREVDGFVTRAVDPQAGVQLAALRYAHDPSAMKFQLRQTQRIGKQMQEFHKKGTLGKHHQVEKHFHFGDEADTFLNKVMRETGVRFDPDPTDFRNPSFLYGKAAQYQDEWTQIMNRTKPSDITVLPGGSIAFGVNSPVKDGDLLKYLANIKELPVDATTQTISLHDRLILESPIGWFATKFAPLRAVMGESHFRAVRRANIDHQTYSSTEIENILNIGRKYGWNSQKLRDQHGPHVGKLVERQLDSNATMNLTYNRVSRSMVSQLEAKAPDTDIEQRIARELGIGQGEAKDVIKGYRTTVGNNQNLLEKMAEQGSVRKADGTAKTLEDFYTDIAADYMHNSLLKKVATMSDDEIATLARKMNTRVDYLKAASEGRITLDRLFQESDIDPHIYRAAYLPHYRQFEGASYKVAMRSFKDIGVRENQAQKIFWANELHRTDQLVSYDQNFFSAASRYVTGMSKSKFFRPVFDDLDKTLKGAGVHTSRVQVYEQLKRSIQGIPSEMETAFDNAFHNFARAIGVSGDKMNAKFVGSLLAELQYTSGMGFNPFMPIRNLTQKALALSSITESGSPIEGLYWLGRAKMAKMSGTDEAKKWIRLNDVLTNRLYTEGLDLQSQGLVKVARMMGASDVAASRMDDVGLKSAMWMFRKSDTSNVEDVFMAKAMYATDRGFALADAVEMARSTTMATQFMYGIDSPMLYKSLLGKQIGIFQSWPLNWSHMLWEQGTQGNMRRAASTVVTMAVASELLSMTGISMRSIHPTETVQGLLPVKMLEGERDWPLAFRSTVAVLDYMRGLADGDPEAVDTAINNLQRSAEGLVPYGAVTTRTLRFIDRVRHDWRDFADTGFMYSAALAPETRENRSRLVRILGEDESSARNEAVLGLLGTTTKSVQRIQDAEDIQRMDASYRRTRRLAVQAFIDEDYDRFQKLQEQLVVNFGQWIEPRDIMREIEYMGQTARERQTRSLPENLEDAFYESILDPRSEDVTPWW